MPPLTAALVARIAGAGVLGAVVGLVGTTIHRARPPWGLVLALLLVVAVAVLARAWVGWSGVLSAGLGIVTVVGLLGARGPGGDVLVAADWLGYAWYAGAVLVLLAGAVPRRWLSDRPLGADRP